MSPDFKRQRKFLTLKHKMASASGTLTIKKKNKEDLVELNKINHESVSARASSSRVNDHIFGN